MAESTTADIKRAMPDWVKFLLAIIVSLATGAVGYGELRGQVAALEQRIERSEHDLERERSECEQHIREEAEQLDAVRTMLDTVRIDVARICAKLKC